MLASAVRESPLFLTGGGASGALMRALDWSGTPLGRPESWPQALKTLVGVMLGSQQPMLIVWGPDHTTLYNDGYAAMCGARHPAALGRPFDDLWHDIWSDVEPILARAYGGVATHMDDIRFIMNRNGYPEETHFAFGYTPVRGEDGTVAGMFCACTETTGKVRAEKRFAFLLELSDRLRPLTEPRAIMLAAVETLGSHLGVSRAGYGQISEGARRLSLETDYVDSVGHLSGQFPLDAFGPANMKALQEGRTTVYDDVAQAEGMEGRALEPYQVRALLAVPLIRGGELRALLHVNHREPRRWTEDDVTLAEEVAARVWDAVERAKAEERQTESEERLQLALYASNGIGTWDWDVVNDIVTADERFATLYGVDPARAAGGAPIAEFFAGIHPQDLPVARQAIETALRTGEPFSAEYRLLQADGSVRWAVAQGNCTLGPDGQPLRFPGVSFDITNLKSAEAALRESEANFRAITNSIDQMIWSTQPDGFHDFFNDRWYEYTGVPYGSTDGAGWNGVFHPDDQERSWTVWQNCLNTGEPYHIEYRLRHHSGAYRWVLGRAQAVRDTQGRIVRWFGTCTDIQEIVDARDVLARSRELLEQQIQDRTVELAELYTKTPVSLHSLGPDQRLLSVSDRWLAFMGFDTAHEVLGRKITDFLTDESARTRLPVAWASLLDNDEVDDCRLQFVKKSGDVADVLLSARVRRDPQGRITRTMASLIDITDRLRAEAERDRAEDALRQAQKMEAVGQLTGGIAHDFNNLLTGISGSLELLQTRMSQGRVHDLDRYINVAQGASKRASALTHRLLAFSRRQTLDPKPTDVNRLIRGMEELVRRTVGPAIEIEVVGAAGLWPALVDPNQLENALLNLCINARDAMPDGGRLTIETANKWLDDRAARERDLPPGQYLSLCVTDTGTGMTPEVIARAFDPFFTTKPIGQGTGLGLSMIYGFARQSGGQVRIYSELGLGTTMCIYLPRHVGAAEIPDASAELSAAPRAEQGQTVLIVDDEPSVRMLITEVLEELGYTAIEVADGASGLKVLQSDVRLDLLITDVGLPGGMNGRQVADAGRVVRPNLKVLFITGYAENAVVGNGHLEPGMQVLTKPFAMDALASRIKDLIAAP
ncbi:PAS domain-containing protein [Microvirga pudoricolor]|uniref:PAS domain-containing protein n=1 Tax=Microvirga pudoricolor TaxID=2778729 RepID=UPI00195074F7|nr:PAS domain-containing protein [Microvirga pudoricolor]MBM6595737.1 PAS domain-containing protein [Microvirga pudoricolor]